MSFHLLADVNKSFFFPEQASTFAEDVDGAYWFIMIIDIVFFVGIVAALVGFAFKYAKKKGEKATSQVSHHTWLEIAWSVLPCFLLVAMFFRGALGYLEMRDPPPGSSSVNVRAFKWGWEIDYGEGIKHPELHLVKGQPTKAIMRSDDYIHSFFIPAFRIKRDIVPKRFNIAWMLPTVASEKVDETQLQEWIEADKESGAVFDTETRQCTEDGYRFFDLYCTEYCGTGHSEMQTRVVVHETQEELDAWLQKIRNWDPDKESAASYGQKLYQRKSCVGCHSVDGRKIVGPTFLNLFGSQHGLTTGETIKVDEDYIRESVLNPQAKIVEGYAAVKMPSYAGQLTDEEIYCLIEFIKSKSSETSK